MKRYTPRQQIIRDAAFAVVNAGDYGGAWYYVKQSLVSNDRKDYWNNASAGAQLAVEREVKRHADILWGMKEPRRCLFTANELTEFC